MTKIAAITGLIVLLGMAIMGTVVKKSNAINTSEQEHQLQQQVALEAYGPESTHQFAANCISKDGIWYDVYYEATEPDLNLEYDLCQKQLVP